MRKVLFDNDTYFLAIVMDKIIVNDNYQGLIILNSDLEVIKYLKLKEYVEFLQNRII